MRLLKRLFILMPLLALGVFLGQSAQAAFNPSYVISDKAFENYGVWSPAQIDSFLNGFGSSCISSRNGFGTPDPQGWSDAQNKYTFGSTVSGGQSIYDVAQLYHVSPWVILSTLQKEQSIPTGAKGCHYDRPNASDASQVYTCVIGGVSQSCTDACPFAYGGGCMNIALGYGCPGSCAVKDEGYDMQLTLGTWLLRFGEERAYGTLTGYAGYETGDQNFCYRGPMTPGMRARSASATACGGSQDNVATYYDGTYTTVDGVSLNITNGGTATLYNFTPYNSGNTSFYNIYSGWFGNPTSPCYNDTNLSGVSTGYKFLPYQYSYPGATSLALTMQNNTGSACSEAHLWSPGYSAWAAHFATAMRASDPAQGTLTTVGAPGSKTDNLAYVLYSGAGGAVEVHKFSPDLQKFPGYYDVATNLGGVSATSGTFVSGDFFGRGYKQLAYVLYNGSGGRVEVHVFNPSLTAAVGYYDVATNLSGVSNSTGMFVAGDFFGRGYDQLAYVVYSDAGGVAEVHVFNPSMTSSTLYEVPTNLTGASASAGTFVAGDFLGRGYDQLAYVLYNGSSGHTEVHTFSPDLRRAVGYQDIATNLPGFTP